MKKSIRDTLSIQSTVYTESFQNMINSHYQYKCYKCGTDCGSDYNAFIEHPCVAADTINEVEMVNLLGQKARVGMSDVVICDIGGEVIVRERAGGFIFWPNQSYRHSGKLQEQTVCPKCARELWEYLKSRNSEMHQMMEAFDPEKEELEAENLQLESSKAAVQYHANNGDETFDPDE